MCFIPDRMNKIRLTKLYALWFYLYVFFSYSFSFTNILTFFFRSTFNLVLVICVLLIHHYSPKQFSQYSIPNLKRSSQPKKKK